MYLLHVLIVVERFQPHAAHDPSAGGGSCFHGQDFNHTVFDLTYEAKYRCGTSSARCSWKNVLAADDCCTVIWFEFMLYIGPHWAKTRLWRFWMSMFLVLGSCFCTLSVSSSKQTNQLDARCLPSSELCDDKLTKRFWSILSTQLHCARQDLGCLEDAMSSSLIFSCLLLNQANWGTIGYSWRIRWH